MKSEIAIELPSPPGERAWPGARHGEWTLALMLREPVRDLLALRGRGADALVLGCGSGAIARRLTELGLERVVGADSRPDLLDAARRECEESGNEALRLERFEELDWSRRFDLVVVESPAGCSLEESEVLRRALPITGEACVIITADRLESRSRASEAGFEKVSLIEPPTDAERSFVLLERCLLIALPPLAGDDG